MHQDLDAAGLTSNLIPRPAHLFSSPFPLCLACIPAFLLLIRSFSKSIQCIYQSAGACLFELQFLVVVYHIAAVSCFNHRTVLLITTSTAADVLHSQLAMSSQPPSPAAAPTSSQLLASSPQSKADSAVQIDDTPEKADRDLSFQSNSSERHPKGKRKRTAYVDTTTSGSLNAAR